MKNIENEIKSAMQNLPRFDITGAQKSAILEAARAFDTNSQCAKSFRLLPRTFFEGRKKLSLAISAATATLALLVFLIPKNNDCEVKNIYATQTRALREYPSSIVEWRNGEAIITTTPTRFDARFKSVLIALEASKYFDETPKIFVVKHELEDEESNRNLYQ